MPAATPAETLKTTDALPKVVRGKGSYLWDANGKQYIDGSGGPAVYCLGHANAEVNRAICDQLDLLAHGYRYNFTTDALEELTAIIRARCGGTLTEMVFVTGGSEAVEEGGLGGPCRITLLHDQHVERVADAGAIQGED